MKRRHSTVDSNDENSPKNVKRQHLSTSLLMLNNFCLLEIFKYLGLDDFISLSRACQHLKSIAELFNRMYTDFKININLDDKDNDYVEHVIANMNTEVTEISIDYSNSKIPMNVRKMTECCGADVKCLRISNWTVDVTDSDNHRFYNLETLTMTDCEFQSVPSEFFELFSGLKAANFCSFHHWSNEFSKKLFCKNPDIESFVWMGDVKAFDEFELFEKLPKLAALSMKVDMKVNEFHIGTAFANLTKLQLYCNGDNISEFLHKLGKSTEAPVLRELELLCVNVDESLFSALHHFRQLEHLAMLTWNYWELQSSALWPNKIKFLRLRSFIISMDCFMSTIKDWEHLVHIDIVGCTISRADRHFFEDSQKLSHAISTALGDNTKQVDFILRERDYLHPIENERFRIFNRDSIYSSIDVSLRFPDHIERVLGNCICKICWWILYEKYQVQNSNWEFPHRITDGNTLHMFVLTD